MSEAHFILVFERKEPDGTSLQEAFAGRVPNPGRVIRTTEAMQEYLERKGAYQDREQFPFPSLVILDFDYPLMSLNLLQWLHQSGYSALFPVIGLGRDLPEIIVQRAFDAGLNGYFEKPAELSLLVGVLCELQWVDDLRRQRAVQTGMKLVTRDEFFARNSRL